MVIAAFSHKGSLGDDILCGFAYLLILSEKIDFVAPVKRTGLITLVVIILTWEASRERSLCNQRSQLSKASARPQKP
jgi:hypothetical protein